MHRQATHYRTLDTPIGRLTLASGPTTLTLIGFPRGSRAVIAEPD